MQNFRVAHARAEDAAAAVRICVEGLGPLEGQNLGFIYLTDPYASDLARVVTMLQDATGIKEWLGSVGMGLIANGCGGAVEYHDEPAVAVMVAEAPAESLRMFQAESGLETFKEHIGPWLHSRYPGFGIVHADPRDQESLDIIEELGQQTGCFLVGGFSAAPSLGGAELGGDTDDLGESLAEGQRPDLSCPDRVAGTMQSGGVSGLLCAGALEVATGVTQGCSPIGPVRTVTDCSDNVIMSLDDRPALDSFIEDIGPELAGDLRMVAGRIFVGRPVTDSPVSDYLVRNLLAIDTDQGWLAIGDAMSEGDTLLFCRRDRDAAERDMRRMLTDLQKRAGKPPKGGLYFSCTARGPNLFDLDCSEIRMIRDVLGDFPLIGFFGNGEVSQGRVYGYTGILTLFL